MSIRQSLESLLNKTNGEREIHKYLKQHPTLVWGMFCNVGGHSDYVISEFRIREKYRCDFVVMQSYSGAWDVHLIELEPVDSSLFKKSDEKPEKRFRGGIDQIEDWKRFISEDQNTFKSCLADTAMNSDLLHPEYNLNVEPSSMACDELRNPKTVIWYNYHVVIGRSSELDSHKQYLKASYNNVNDIKVHTYDRLLHVADALDKGVPLFNLNNHEE